MNGIFLFHKPQGITSHDSVYLLRKKTGIQKVGHTGTLDPMATGVLPICIGKATKISQYIVKGDKEYFVTIQWGVETDTYDMMGKVLHRETPKVEIETLNKELENFLGVQEQIPPMYSALKVKGKKLYEYARQGIHVDRPPRKISIQEIELQDFSKESCTLRILCSSGTYIRSFAHDLGERLGTFATVSALTRTKVLPFTLNQCHTITALEEMTLQEVEQSLYPMDQALLHLKKFEIPQEAYEKILQGGFYPLEKKMPKEYYRLYCQGEFLGIGELRERDNTLYMKMNKKLIR